MKKLLLFLCVLAALPLAAQKKGRLEKLDPNVFQLKTIHLKGTLLDVRNSDEYKAEHLKGAKQLDWDGKSFKDEAKKLPKYEPVFVYCQGGYRSNLAAEWFIEQGFSTVIVLNNGIDAWKDAGLPVEGEAVQKKSDSSYD
jgi:rhodanese-related sulfurtransferase